MIILDLDLNNLIKIEKNQKIARRSIIDIIGNTPLIYLPKLSQAAGSHIYVTNVLSR